MKRFLKLLSLLLCLLLCFGPVAAANEDAASAAHVPAIETDVSLIQKYGNLVLTVTASDLLGLGYAYGDLIAVTVSSTPTSGT